MHALLLIAVAAQAGRRVQARCGLSRRRHAVDPVAGQYRGELRGQTGLTAWSRCRGRPAAPGRC